MPSMTDAVRAEVGKDQPRAQPSALASARHERTVRLAAIRARDASGGSRVRAFCALLRIAWSEYEHDYARYFATAMVYYALISLVPLVLLLLATLGLLLRLSDVASDAAQHVLLAVETSFGSPLRETIENLLERIEQGSLIATIISLAGLLVTASVLFGHLRITFRALWKHKPPLASGSVRGAVLETALEKAIAFAIVLAGGPLLLAALVLIGIMHWIGGMVSQVPLIGGVVGWLLAISSSLIFVPLTFALLFRYLPPLKPRWHYIWPATLLCSMAWFLGTELLALYAVYFGHNVSAYGALGAALMIMLWMKVMSQVLFYGAEVCKIISWSSTPVSNDPAVPA
jgi:membrane protein